VYRVLERLMILEGQRLSYKVLVVLAFLLPMVYG
jgi:hypothetical protein